MIDTTFGVYNPRAAIGPVLFLHQMQRPSGLQVESQPSRPELFPKGRSLGGKPKRVSTLLGREQEIALQASQVVDALFLVAALWVAH
ncbi:MAG TPA: hypothetical protein VE641_06595, partial [Chthoniobacterales bacterium]|nr:hypothetical protein [Chthoniobacterales bacterium]